MTTFGLDTAAAIYELKKAKCDEPLATAIVNLIAEQHDELATKNNIEQLRAEVKLTEQRLKLWIVSAIVIGIGLIKALDYILPAIGS